jgi:NAD+ synthase
MSDPLSLTLAQLNPVVGDLDGNAEKVLDVWREAESDLVVFPELVLSGYPPEDLVINPNFINLVEDKVKALLEASRDFYAGALVTAPWRIDDAVCNCAQLIYRGEIVAVQAKYHLPNYGVFDEKRVFTAGALPSPITFKGHALGILICEDMWFPDVAAHLKEQGAEILIVPNGSPWRIGKEDIRESHAVSRSKETGLPLVYVNQVGGQDELIFDGNSFFTDASGQITQRLKSFEEDVVELGAESAEPTSSTAAIYEALKLGLRDYVTKNGFPGVLLGLSGGIDSALTAAIAVDALGADKVKCYMLPSLFTSQDSLDDAKACAEALGTHYEIYPIDAAMKAFEGTIPDLDGIAHENMQSRSRGVILMALSNASGDMLLTTGNKSEMAVGYATLYGDMNGGFNPLKDVYKTQVYALSKWRNEQGAVIPERIITKAPSAELRENQTDQDSLPEYDVLDDILTGLIENQDSLETIAERGHDIETIRKVAHLLRISEYKRYQAPVGTRITSRAFGRDRRYPMTNRYKFD